MTFVIRLLRLNLNLILNLFFHFIRNDNTMYQTGVTYEVVSNIPKASEELEDRESLAQIAASGDDCSAIDGETYIEKYTKGVSAVESILTLDRLRQSVAVKELETAHGQPLSMRKTVSVPNFSQVRDLFNSLLSLLIDSFDSPSVCGLIVNRLILSTPGFKVTEALLIDD